MKAKADALWAKFSSDKVFSDNISATAKSMLPSNMEDVLTEVGGTSASPVSLSVCLAFNNEILNRMVI